MPVGADRIACPSVSVCHAVGTSQVDGTARFVNQAESSTDGGNSWQVDRVRARPGVLLDLSCPTTTTCLAVGYVSSQAKVLATTDSGVTWRSMPPPVGIPELDQVACVSVASCVLIGVQSPSVTTPAAFTSTDLGVTYQPRKLPPMEYLLGLDCAGSTCVAAGRVDNFHEAIVTSHDSGMSWTAQPPPTGALYLRHVSCGSATACVVTAIAAHRGAGAIVGTTDAGQTWRAFALPVGEGEPSAVTCAGSSCIASETSSSGNPRVVAGRA
jgi:photosystem II stability/assembly factor-like uncharacterized protein